jgi:hypothetical protein
VARALGPQRRGNRVRLRVLAYELADRGIGHRIHFGHEIADAVPVDRKTEFHFGRDFVALGHGNVTHVVPEARELRALPILPRPRRAHPSADAILHLRVAPVADDHLPPESHTRVNESCLTVAVRRLVEIHEIHVDRAPRQVAVELRVQMEKRLPQQIQSADPHLRRRERVHPQDQPRARCRGIGFDTQRRDLVGRRQQLFENNLVRNARRGTERRGDFLRIFRDLLERAGAVEVLGAGNEPDFGNGEVFHRGK